MFSVGSVIKNDLNNINIFSRRTNVRPYIIILPFSSDISEIKKLTKKSMALCIALYYEIK
jgi:hypothetical protein